MNEMTGWNNFYVIVGSSTGALIGLQFVVMSLIARENRSPSETLGNALATPTIVHLGAVLWLSAIVSIPWHSLIFPIVIWGLTGLCGLGYIAIVFKRVLRQREYKLVFEDWLFHILLPLVAYLNLSISAFAALFFLSESLLGIAATVLLLLFVSIHNAWDSTAYHVFTAKK